MENRVEKILKKENEAIWFLEHPSLFTVADLLPLKKVTYKIYQFLILARWQNDLAWTWAKNNIFYDRY